MHMYTVSGRPVDIFDPQPEMFDIHDIAHHLSIINRWVGASFYPISVAQHSLAVCNACPPALQMNGLMHDAAEAYVGDVNRRQKTDEFRSVENRILHVICKKYGIRYAWMPSVIKHDHNVGATEAQIHTVLPEEYWDGEPIYDPMVRGIIRSCISPEQARTSFLRAFKHLGGDI